MPLKDCFALETKTTNIMGQMEMIKTCTALKETYCMKKRFNGVCPFYKSREQWENEMERMHGTINIDAVTESYSKNHGGEK